MNNDRLLMLVMMIMMVVGVVLNYNLSENRFGTNLTVIGILGLIIMKLYRDSTQSTTQQSSKNNV